MTHTRTDVTAPSTLTELRDGVLIITLNRPHARNAMNADMAEQIGDALERAHHDPDVRVVVLTGAGEQAFCGGGDLVAMSEGQSLEPADPVKEAWGFGGVCRHPIDKPIIAAVNGFAVGGGAQIVLTCDLVVAEESAVFSLPEVGNGLVASSGAQCGFLRGYPGRSPWNFCCWGADSLPPKPTRGDSSTVSCRPDALSKRLSRWPRPSAGRRRLRCRPPSVWWRASSTASSSPNMMPGKEI